MTVNINGTTGVSLIQTGAVPSGTAIANGSFTGNVSITGASSYLNINGNNVSPYSGMMKNRIINGDMRIDQRFNGAANNGPTAGGAQYIVDRWRHPASFVGKMRLQRNNTNGPGSSATQIVTGFEYYFGANTISSNTVNADDYWGILQDIEGFNTADLNWGTAIAAPVTLSFWTYSSIAGTHSGSLRNSNGDRSYPFSYTINTANTWQYQTITVPGDTTGSWFSNTGTGISLAFSLGMGTNRQSTAGSWQSGNYLSTTGSVQVVNNANGSFYLTGVQLEKGSQATAFDFRHYTTELQLCQRYYETSEATFSNPMWNGYCVNGSSQFAPAFFKVTKRTAPSVILTSTFASLFANTSGGAVLIAVDSFYESRGATGTGQGHFSSQFRASAELGAQN